MLKKLREKLRAKFPATTPSCSVVKIGHLNDFSWNIFNPKQAREKANHSSKKKAKQREKRKGKKNISKVEKPKAVGHFLVQKKFDFCACLGQTVFNTLPVARTASCRVANAFSTRLKLIWPRSSIKTTKMPKRCNLGKKFQVSKG